MKLSNGFLKNLRYLSFLQNVRQSYLLIGKDIRLDSPTLDELNSFAKRLDSLNDEERLVLQAVVPRILPDHSEGELVSIKDFTNMTYGLDTVMIASNVGNDEQLGQLVIEEEMNEDVASVPDAHRVCLFYG